MKDLILGMDKIIDTPEPFPYDHFYDPRPLTEETLKELGFELKADGRWVFIYKRKNRDKPLYDIKLRQGGNLFDAKINGIHQFKTVGKVKMLIEALKGGK